MTLRCLLFSSDDGTAQSVGQVLTGLGIETEHCSTAIEATQKITNEHFQLVIVDWNNQSEGGLLLKTARERKAAERPLTLAIVGDDASVPQALQAGANSILRKPILMNHVHDTLITARDLLRAKLETPAPNPPAAVAATPAQQSSPFKTDVAKTTLHAGEFLQSGTAPGTHFDIESEVQISLDHAAGAEIDPLQNLEPMAASVNLAEVTADPIPAPADEAPRGLEWYMKARAGTRTLIPPPASEKPEMLGYDQTSSQPASSSATEDGLVTAYDSNAVTSTAAAPGAAHRHHDQKTEAELFAYMERESGPALQPDEGAKPRPHFRKVAFIAALLLICGVGAIMPQAPWHRNAQIAFGRAARAGHAWLNPQPVTPAQAPVSHESFERAGNEYKLPVAENIPDATTDPAQIRVLPVIDPTVKQPNSGAAQGSGQTGDSNATPATGGEPPPTTEGQPTTGADGVVGQQPASSQGPGAALQGAPATPNPQPTTIVNSAGEASNSGSTSSSLAVPPVKTASLDHPSPPRVIQPHYVSAPTSAIPSSMKSQMTEMTSAGGNKPVEAALPSIEPVNLPEATARGFLVEQNAPVYPLTAQGKQGTVVLQVLIGRDGTVQDAKFMQGSLAFARTAIDAVKLWRFNPYLMNNRPASVQTLLTLSFKPAS